MNKVLSFQNFRFIFKEIFTKFLESFMSVLPILVVVAVVYGFQFLLLDLNYINKEVISLSLLITFIISGLVLSIGMGIFSLGADMSMTSIGRYVGEDLTKRKSILLMVIVGFLLGTLATIAEPDLTVLAEYIPSEQLNPLVFKVVVGIGIGLFLVFGILRILFSQSIKLWVILLYGIVFMIACLYGDGNEAFLELSFDASGVTTGQITVPFLISFGVGIAGVRGGAHDKDNSFGMSGIASVGPIILVLIFGLILGPVNLESQTNDTYTLFEAFMVSLEDVGLAIAPILGFFILYDIIFLRLHKEELFRILVGFVYTFVGLVIFLTAANYGFIPVGKALGVGFIDAKFMYIILAIFFGALVVLAEPGVHILNEQVEDVSNGRIKKKTLLLGLSIGIALSVLISVLKALYFPHLSLLYILAPGYIVGFILSLFIDDMFIAVAFDGGGIAAGSMSSAFIMPFIIGIASVAPIKSNGFGVIGTMVMFPFVTIELIGVISKIDAVISNKKARDKIRSEYDAQIITF